jgi:hypothetical protein
VGAIEDFLHTVGHAIALVVEAIALFLIAMGTVEALIGNTRSVQRDRDRERAA